MTCRAAGGAGRLSPPALLSVRVIRLFMPSLSLPASFPFVQVPVIEVDSLVAMCDGSSVGGHPIEFIKLDKREGKGPAVCKFCGLRYKASAHAGHGH